jgi:hypothetical protein
MALDLRALAEQLGDEEHRVEADMAPASPGALRGEDTMAAWPPCAARRRRPSGPGRESSPAEPRRSG